MLKYKNEGVVAIAGRVTFSSTGSL